MERLNPAAIRSHLAQFTDDWAFINRTMDRLTKQPASKTVEELHEEAMSRGSAKLIEAISLAREGRPTGTSEALLWDRRTGLDVEGCEGAHWERYQPEEIRPRVRRDPCAYCGTRADIGCKHMVARGSW